MTDVTGRTPATIAHILQQARTLTVQERKELVKLLVESLGNSEGNIQAEQHSILELAGLGAEVWEGIDAQEYIHQLRSEWDHRP